MKIKKPLIGILAFFIVLLTMPLGHAAMILMEKGFGHEYIYHAAIILGLIGLILIVWGVLINKDIKSTFLGLFGGLFIWTGWIEFAFVYYANRFHVAPLMENGEVVTKPEYLIMPSSIGFWAILMMFYFFCSKSGCKFFNWFQQKLKVRDAVKLHSASPNFAMTTMMELIALLWTFYLVLLFVYDSNFFGDRHPVTYIIAFGSLLWSGYLFLKLLRIPNTGYAIRYAIPTVIIFWNFVEILGRWDVFKEIWIEPGEYWLEMLLIFSIFVILVVIGVFGKRKSKISQARHVY
ncbi:MAG: hypothetical protein K8S16_19045 [Bacteroidales bacterium]|nr:hypothetical protein [Bacteroidales bacterium]